jgi:hypothetical protein
MEKELEIKLQKDGRLRRVEKNKIWYERVIKTNRMLESWRDWWRMVELESVKDVKKRRLTRQEEKKKCHMERIAPKPSTNRMENMVVTDGGGAEERNNHQKAGKYKRFKNNVR